MIWWSFYQKESFLLLHLLWILEASLNGLRQIEAARIAELELGEEVILVDGLEHRGAVVEHSAASVHIVADQTSS